MRTAADLLDFSQFKRPPMPNPMTDLSFTIRRPSVAVAALEIFPLAGTCYVDWQSGHESAHRIRRRDIARVLMPGTGLGWFVNRFLDLANPL
ncbi:MAG: hypothetical protein ACK5PF_11045 [bacterium]